MEFDVFQAHDLDYTIRVAVTLIFLLGGLLAVVFTIWGGFLMIVSGGAEEKVKLAINHMRHAVIGIVFLFAVLFIGPKILDLIGLEGSRYLSASAVFSTMQELSARVFGSSVELVDPTEFHTQPVIDDNFSNL